MQIQPLLTTVWFASTTVCSGLLNFAKIDTTMKFPIAYQSYLDTKDKQFKLKKAHIAGNPGFTYREEVTLVTDKYVCMFHTKR